MFEYPILDTTHEDEPDRIERLRQAYLWACGHLNADVDDGDISRLYHALYDHKGLLSVAIVQEDVTLEAMKRTIRLTEAMQKAWEAQNELADDVSVIILSTKREQQLIVGNNAIGITYIYGADDPLTDAEST